MRTLIVICLITFVVSVLSLPILPLETQVIEESEIITNDNENKTEALEPLVGDVEPNNFSITARNVIRPGQTVTNYAVEIEPNVDDGTFNGRLVASLIVTQATREDDIVFHVENLNIHSVMFSFAGGSIFNEADFNVDDGRLEIDTGFEATLYTLIIEYDGFMNAGDGLFVGHFSDGSYMGMNLHPTKARRVFPCMDEPTQSAATVSFTFNDVPYANIISNSMLEDNSASQFRPLLGPPHRWSMVAHNFFAMVIPIVNVMLFGRPGLNQDAQASVAIQSYFNGLNEWTDKPFTEIVMNQDGRLGIFALPDTSIDWYGLSTVGIWEPYILMETTHSIKQRKTALLKIAQEMARQWFGYVIYPENWSSQWVIEGLGLYSAYEMFNSFQTDPLGFDETLLDVNTLFVSDTIQESLLRDGYAIAHPLAPGDDMFDDWQIRDHINNGILKYKAPALLRMLRLLLGTEADDYIELGAKALLNSRTMDTINTRNFVDSISSYWMFSDNKMIDDIHEFLEPWIENRGYPLIHVGLRQNGIIVTQEQFGFTETSDVTYTIPLTYTTNINPNFDSIYPITMMDNTELITVALDEEDFVLFNIQGQGYYRVDYDNELWERIIWALEDPDQRENIHPLNRATLVDDSLNTARAGKLSYDTAFQVVLTMEHETEYAVWKAFVRNMDFLRKRLVALVEEDEDLDPDIYLRMVRRTIGRVEDEIGFYPELNVNENPMISLTRGLVMDHACRANYQPCIAAAVDWFWNPDNPEVVNPNIPHDMRPAVYCTMVREGGDDIVSALYDRLEIEPSHYERVVILESLACSQDNGFINSYLMETIAGNSPYGVEEKSKIFAAVAESSFQNAGVAMNFMSMRTSEIRNTYGGPEKLEEMIFILADNMADGGLSNDFTIWVNSINSNLDDSDNAAERARDLVNENMVWVDTQMENVYEWIDENDAPTLVVSTILICSTFLMTLLNH